jgi:hypothetical protein
MSMNRVSRRTLWVAAVATGVIASCQPFTKLAETAEPVGTMRVSGSAAGEAIGMSYVEGIVSFRDARYRVTFHGVEPSSSSTGQIYHLAYATDLAGTYTPAQSGRVRNERGVEIAFAPPLRASGGSFQIRFDGRLTPKGTVRGSGEGH